MSCSCLKTLTIDLENGSILGAAHAMHDGVTGAVRQTRMSRQPQLKQSHRAKPVERNESGMSYEEPMTRYVVKISLASRAQGP